MPADVEFNVTPEGELVTEAIVALSEPARTTWPLGGILDNGVDQSGINDALRDLYDVMIKGTWLAVPQIYPTYHQGEVVGYLVMPQRNDVSGADITGAFWAILQINGKAVNTNPDPDADWSQGWWRFTENPPFYSDGTWDNNPVGIVAYPHPYGPPLPAEAINHALVTILGQGLYPLSDMQPYLYRATRDGDDRSFGLLVAENQGELSTDPVEVEAAFRTVHNLNRNRDEKTIPEQYRRARFY